MVKNPLAMQENPVRFLDWEDPLENGQATHSSILAWRTPWTEESGRLQSVGSQRGRRDQVTFTYLLPLWMYVLSNIKIYMGKQEKQVL